MVEYECEMCGEGVDDNNYPVPCPECGDECCRVCFDDHLFDCTNEDN